MLGSCLMTLRNNNLFYYSISGIKWTIFIVNSRILSHHGSFRSTTSSSNLSSVMSSTSFWKLSIQKTKIFHWVYFKKKKLKKPMKTSAWQLLNLWWLDTTIIFYKNRGLAKLPCLETATMTFVLSPLLKNFFNKFICVDYTQFESPPARKPA